MLRFSFIIIALLAGLQSADAQLSYMRIDQQICTLFGCRDRSIGFGSCVAVAHYRGGTVLLTAGHNLERDSSEHKIVSLTVAGKPCTVRGSWFRDAEWPGVDIAILYQPNRLFNLVPLANTPPKAGDDILVGGFGFDDPMEPQVKYYRGKVFEAASGSYGSADFIWPVGISGGSVTRDGELVGIAVHQNSKPRTPRDLAGFTINWNFRQAILQNFPGATFARVPGPPVVTGDEPRSEPVLDKPVPPPRDIPARQKGGKDGGRDAVPVLTPVPDKTVPKQPDKSAELKQALAELSKTQELLKKASQTAQKAAPVVEAVVDTTGDAATSDWFSTGLKVAATAAFGPPGAAGATVLTGVGGWMWNRRRKRKLIEKQEAEAEFNRVAAENDQRAVDQNNQEREERRKAAEAAAINEMKVRQLAITDAEERAAAAEKEAEELKLQLAETTEKQDEPETEKAAPDKTDEVDELREQIAGLVEYLKEQEVSPETIPGITAEEVVGPNGGTQLAYFLDGIRLLESNQLPVKVLGHREAVRAIEDYVYRRAAAETGNHLQTGNKS